MLDAGHDINTPGKGVAGMKEFEFNRAVVQNMQTLLAGYEGVETFLSHDLNDGIDTSLKDRVDLANRLGVDCFCSVHGNAASSVAARGIETFVDPQAPKDTVNLGAVVHGELIRATGMVNRGLKRADFYVLDKTNMSAFLTECGFMTNASDLAKLKDNAYRQSCAEAIVNGLVQHYKLVKKVEKKKVGGVNVSYTDKVTTPYTSFWQAQALVQEYQKRGFKCYLVPTRPYETQEDGFGCPFVVETDFQHANLVKMELENKGYAAVWETI